MKLFFILTACFTGLFTLIFGILLSILDNEVESSVGELLCSMLIFGAGAFAMSYINLMVFIACGWT